LNGFHIVEGFVYFVYLGERDQKISKKKSSPMREHFAIGKVARNVFNLRRILMVIREIGSLYGKYKLGLPTTYWIDISSRCNLRCIMCPQHNALTRPTGFMPLRVFTKLIDQIKVNRPLIKLYMSGEPLLHGDLLEIISYAAKSGCRTMIHTNATLLTNKMSEKLLRSGLTYLSFSFDGCDKKTYESLRIGASFESVKSNIETFLEMKDRLKNRLPVTSIEIIKLKQTAGNLDGFLSFWKAKGADSLSIREGMTWIGSVPDYRSDDIFVQTLGLKPCHFPFLHSAVLSNGDVVPCCLDVNGVFPLGNICEDSFWSIWKGRKYKKLRIAQLNRKIPHDWICFGCEEMSIVSLQEKVVWNIFRLFGGCKLLSRRVKQSHLNIAKKAM